MAWQPRVRALCDRIDRWSIAWAGIAGLLVLLLALLTVALVVARAGFAWTANGWDELRWHLFAAIFLLAMAGCLASGGHVRVDVVHQRLRPRWRAGIELVLTVLILLPFCAIMTVRGTAYAHGAWALDGGRAADHFAQQWSGGTSGALYGLVAPIEGAVRASVLRGERSPNEGGLEARWLVKALIPLGFALLGLQAIAHALRQATILRPEPPGGADAP